MNLIDEHPVTHDICTQCIETKKNKLNKIALYLTSVCYYFYLLILLFSSYAVTHDLELIKDKSYFHC